MRALIFEKDDRPGVGAFDIAGRCLLVRQLQALRTMGIEAVAVEVCDGPRAVERAHFLLGDDPLVSKVTLVPSGAPLGLAELARRAGFDADEPFLALPADTLFHAELELARVPARYELSRPDGTDLLDAELTIESLTRRAAASPRFVQGWGVRIPNEAAAHQLGCAALSGVAQGIMIHGAEARPGVWCARGARIADDANVTPPVLLGVDALVMSHAQVGPRVVLGDRVVVERSATVSDAAVAADTIVGESTQLKRVRADALGTTGLDDGVRSEVHDPLVLSARAGLGAPLAARLVAVALLALLGVPWLVVALARRIAGKASSVALHTNLGALHVGACGNALLDLVPSLADVLGGRRDLVGVSDRKALEVAFSRANSPGLRAGALDISSRLAPGASTSTLLRMWRWYAAHKNASLDWSLCARSASRKAE